MAEGSESNAVALFRSWLLSSSTITDQTGASDVYATEIPDTRVDSMPKKLILLIPDGGPTEDVSVPVLKATIQCRTYGDTPYNASVVNNALFQHAHRKGAFQITLSGSTYNVYVSRRLGPPVYYREPEVGWPQYSSRYEFQIYETAVG